MSRVVATVGAFPGAGATTVVAGLGAALAEQRHHVALLDASEEGSRVDDVLSLEDGGVLADALRRSADLADVQASGPHGVSAFPAAPDTTWSAIRPGAVASVYESLRQRFELTLVDCGSAVTPSSAAWIGHADEVLIVTDPDCPDAVEDVAGLAAAFDVPVRGLVANRVVRDELDAAQSDLPATGHPLLAVLPEDQAVGAAADERRSLLVAAPDSQIASCLWEFARRTVERDHDAVVVPQPWGGSAPTSGGTASDGGSSAAGESTGSAGGGADQRGASAADEGTTGAEDTAGAEDAAGAENAADAELDADAEADADVEADAATGASADAGGHADVGGTGAGSTDADAPAPSQHVDADGGSRAADSATEDAGEGADGLGGSDDLGGSDGLGGSDDVEDESADAFEFTGSDDDPFETADDAPGGADATADGPGDADATVDGPGTTDATADGGARADDVGTTARDDEPSLGDAGASAGSAGSPSDAGSTTDEEAGPAVDGASEISDEEIEEVFKETMERVKEEKEREGDGDDDSVLGGFGG